MLMKNISVNVKKLIEKIDLKSLVSRNFKQATIMTQLMPLLLLGIPITSSETLLLAIIDINTYIINFK